MNKIKILIIEDDDLTAELLYNYLQDCDFEVDVTNSVTTGLSNIKFYNYSIILLDLNLPDFDGFEFLKYLKQNIAIPTIVISAYSDTPTKVKAFKYGASDYMVKPIELEELEARIWAVLGRNSQIKTKITEKTFTIKENTIYFHGKSLELTPIEFDIMSVFIKKSNQIIPREELASSLSSISSVRSLDYHIKNIRKKLNDNISNPKYLKTQYAVGYKLVN